MTTEIQKVESKDGMAQKKEIEAFIESFGLIDPNLKARMNLQIIWNFLQMPDSSFGWTADWKGAMPWRVKLMSIAAHIEAGAKPGYGHIYFLGNKLYLSAEFVRQKANADDNFKCLKTGYYPLTVGEKEIYGLTEGDLALKTIWEVEKYDPNRKNYSTCVYEGVGIIGKDELDKRDNKGNPMPGKDTRKNIAATLKTRAVRDLLKYHYASQLPVGGDWEDDKKEFEEINSTQSLQIIKQSSDEFDLAKTREILKSETIEKEKEIELVESKKSLQEAKRVFEESLEELKKAGLLLNFLKENDLKLIDIGGISSIEYLESLASGAFEFARNFPEEVQQEKKEEIKEAVKEEEPKKRGRKPKEEKGDSKDEIDIEIKIEKESKNFIEDLPENVRKQYGIIDRLVAHESVKDRKDLIDLLLKIKATKILKEGDQHIIVESCRECVKGNNLTKLAEFANSRADA